MLAAVPRRTTPAVLAVLFALLAAAACARPPAVGPAFAAASGPAPGFARVYVFRIDPQSSLSSVELAVDGEDRGRLHNGEYVTFELPAGSHRIDVRQRGFAFASFGWNRQRVRVRDGETVYLELSVRMSAQPIAGSGQDLEIPGRDVGAASENVFVHHIERGLALERLARTTLRVE